VKARAERGRLFIYLLTKENCKLFAKATKNDLKNKHDQESTPIANVVKLYFFTTVIGKK
jgi:hypothetical protein